MFKQPWDERDLRWEDFHTDNGIRDKEDIINICLSRVGDILIMMAEAVDNHK